MSEVEPRDANKKSGPLVSSVSVYLMKRRIAMINNAAKRESAAFKDSAVSPQLAEAYVGPAIIEFLVSERGT